MTKFWFSFEKALQFCLFFGVLATVAAELNVLTNEHSDNSRQMPRIDANLCHPRCNAHELCIDDPFYGAEPFCGNSFFYAFHKNVLAFSV